EEEEIRKIPANVTVITAEEIENSNARTVADLLRSEEGIVVRDLLGNGKTSQVDLRGFGEAGPYNTLVLVDGRRVNEIDLSGVDWTQIPLDQVQRVEVVRGTGTVLYGDNAVGGVINIITKPPAEKLTAKMSGLAGSYGRNKGEASVSGGYENIAASLFGSYDSTNGYRDNGEFRTRDIGGKVVYDVSDILSLNLSGSYHRDDFGLPGALSEEELETDRRSTNPRFAFDNGETTDQYLKLGADWDLGKYGRIVFDSSSRDRETESQFFAFGTFVEERETDTWAITPRYVWNGEISNHANSLIAGVDIYWSEQDVENFFAAAGPPVPSGSASAERDSYGFYFNNEFSVLENLILSLGARHERVRYDLRQQDSTGSTTLEDTVTEHENAYSAGLTYLYNEKSAFFVRANRSLRFPLTDELVETDLITFQPRLNSDLKPQIGKHYEVGVRHYFTPDIQGTVTLFRAKIKDEIFLDPTTFPGFNENHPETLHQGIEIGSKADLFKKVAVFGNYTFEKATFEKDPFKNNDIPAVPRHKVNLGLQIYDVVPGFILSADYNFVGSSFLISDQANEFDKLSKYYTLNARLSYQWRGFKAFVGVNNITN
ncbi:MAG: TonB-dependent receptor, partial [candidate division Zixibacteria bacterium]|nr:TonB-dependent receptor [candidate division Zixibacteria bacterium]